MTKVLSIGLLTSGSTSWTAEKDYVIVGVYATNINANIAVTTDPSASATLLAIPTSANVRSWDHIACVGATQRTINFPIRVPLPAGTQLYFFATVASSTIFIYLDDPIPAEIDHVV